MPNIGTLTGLTPSTEYVLDAVHVDAWGNVSAVASSPPFTTGVASAGPTVSDTTGSPIITVNHDNGGTLGTLYQFDVDGSITFSTGGDVEYAMVGGGAPGGMSSGALRAGGGGGGGQGSPGHDHGGGGNAWYRRGGRNRSVHRRSGRPAPSAVLQL
jgi:hypothetical protein